MMLSMVGIMAAQISCRLLYIYVYEGERGQEAFKGEYRMLL